MGTMELYEISKHFSERSNTYDKLGTWVNNDSILSCINSYLPKTPKQMLSIIDLGAGTGAVSKYILKKYPFEKNITAIDICPDMLKKIEQPEIKKIVCSLEKIPLDNNQFDIAVSRQCLHYVENIECVTREIKRILKNNGIFILAQIVPFESQTKEYWRRIIQHRQPLRKHFFSEKEWTNLFINQGFSLLSINRFSHRASVMKWVDKYGIIDTDLIDMQKKLLLDAPKEFNTEYNVLKIGDDISYDSFWFVAKFGLIK